MVMPEAACVSPSMELTRLFFRHPAEGASRWTQDAQTTHGPDEDGTEQFVVHL